jgi:hypothetical protein
MVSETEILVEFPSMETLRICTRSSRLYLPIKQRDTNIREDFLEPKSSVVLEKVLVQLEGVPKPLRSVEALKAALTWLEGMFMSTSYRSLSCR